ncbi:phage tail tube protein, partial [Streptomyces sp. NPDC058534]|uniref:phage tail tube protein n=1 Tax=Streptomyces sp. NPDC058534 TaxID=3346541 RepID=UPI003647DE9F
PKYNARDVVFEIEDPDTPDTWVRIEGINTFTKSHEEETTDTTTFGSQGEGESEKMQKSKTLSIEGFRMRNPADPGQVLVETLHERLAEDSLGGFRFAHKADTSWEVWTAHVNLGDHGGGNNDKASWSATFTRSGANTTAVKA